MKVVAVNSFKGSMTSMETGTAVKADILAAHPDAEVTAALTGKAHSLAKGAGVAGGLGFAFLSYLNGRLTPGVQLLLNAINLEDKIKNADIVVTGEGQMKHQPATRRVLMLSFP